MNKPGDHDCQAVSTEELLLLAYGELEDERVKAHARECETCRRYLAGVQAVRSLAAAGGLSSPGADTLKALRQAASLAAAKARAGEAPVLPHPSRLPARPRRLWPALLLAAVLVLVIGALFTALVVRSTREGTGLAGRKALYLSGVNQGLSDLERQMNENQQAMVGGGGNVGFLAGDSAEALAGFESVAAENEGIELTWPDESAGETVEPAAVAGAEILDPILFSSPELGELEVAMIALEEEMGMGWPSAADAGDVEAAEGLDFGIMMPDHSAE